MVATFNPANVANLPAHDQMVANILRVWHSATDTQREQGTHWYNEARDYAETMAAGSPYSVEQCAGVIAALSPQQDWAMNKRIALRCITAHAAGEPIPSVHYAVQCAKVLRILEGEYAGAILKGPKENAFYNNILGSPEFVTVDRWAFKTATGTSLSENGGGISRGAFKVLAAAYRAAGLALGVTLPTLQAVCWVVERGSAD